MMLRTDVTPAVAKLVSYQLKDAQLPVRVSYANKVIRTSRSAVESIERYHLGIELIGVDGLLGDLEVFLVALEVLERLGVRDFQFNVCDNGVADYLLNATGAPRRIRDAVWEAIIARDASEVNRILMRLGIRQHYIDAISALASLEGGLHQLVLIEEAMPNDRILKARLEDMRTLFEVLSELGYKRHIRLDMAELGGADYYTGISFNIVSEKVGRSLGRGGRYDNLFENFGTPASAAGFSLIAEVLVELVAPVAAAPARKSTDDHVSVVRDDLLSGLTEALERRRYNKTVAIKEGTR